MLKFHIYTNKYSNSLLILSLDPGGGEKGLVFAIIWDSAS